MTPIILLKMVLSTKSEIQERITNPEHREVIAKAIKHEQRLAFHVDSETETEYFAGRRNPAVNDFLKFVERLIAKDKFQTFLSLFRFPVASNNLTDSIFKELEKVFEGGNAVSLCEFSDSGFKDDWHQYKHQINLEHSFKEKSIKAMKTAINSLIVVDMPQLQKGGFPEPYFYFLPICEVIDFDYEHETDTLEWVLFEQEDKIAYFDGEKCMLFDFDEKNKALIGEPLVTTHNLGYCPAQFFWTDSINRKGVLKKSPISDQLTKLDWYVFFEISKKHLDLYAAYPIYSAYARNCDYENENGDSCDSGFLRGKDDKYLFDSLGGLVKCPICAKHNITGAGTFVTIPLPLSKDDADLKNPVTILSIDKASLDYNTGEVERLGNEIFFDSVGKGGEVLGSQSVNEVQVTANFESKTAVLNSLKRNLERAKKFIIDTICKLRYDEAFLGSTVSLGDKFYLLSTTELYEKMKTAKENGASKGMIYSINSQILENEFRMNPTEMHRQSILREIEPYPDYTLSELMILADKGLIDTDLLQIKLNFSTFVERFERENIGLVEFGSQLDYATKISKITETFLTYVKNGKTSIEGSGSQTTFRP